MGLGSEKNEAIADIDYFIHEIKENGKSEKSIKKLEKCKSIITESTSSQKIQDNLTMAVHIFQKEF